MIKAQKSSRYLKGGIVKLLMETLSRGGEGWSLSSFSLLKCFPLCFRVVWRFRTVLVLALRLQWSHLNIFKEESLSLVSFCNLSSRTSIFCDMTCVVFSRTHNLATSSFTSLFSFDIMCW